MKQINLLSALLLLCLYACNNKPYPHIMQVADKLVYSNPDSACLLLEQRLSLKIWGILLKCLFLPHEIQTPIPRYSLGAIRPVPSYRDA